MEHPMPFPFSPSLKHRGGEGCRSTEGRSYTSGLLCLVPQVHPVSCGFSGKHLYAAASQVTQAHSGAFTQEHGRDVPLSLFQLCTGSSLQQLPTSHAWLSQPLDQGTSILLAKMKGRPTGPLVTVPALTVLTPYLTCVSQMLTPNLRMACQWSFLPIIHSLSKQQ